MLSLIAMYFVPQDLLLRFTKHFEAKDFKQAHLLMILTEHFFL